MSYRKRYNKKRKPLFTKKASQVQVNSMTQIKKLAGYIPWLISTGSHLKRLINTELKYIDTVVQITGVSNSGNVDLLSGISTGTDLSNRIGRTIKPMYIHLNGSVYLNTNSAQAQVRTIIVVDSETDGVAPVPLDILQVANPLSQYNITTNKGRFQVICDRLTVVDNTQKRIAPVYCTAKLYKKIQYEGTGATISSASKNHLFMLNITDQTANPPDVVMNVRIRFVDN